MYYWIFSPWLALLAKYKGWFKWARVDENKDSIWNNFNQVRKEIHTNI